MPEENDIFELLEAKGQDALREGLVLVYHLGNPNDQSMVLLRGYVYHEGKLLLKTDKDILEERPDITGKFLEIISLRKAVYRGYRDDKITDNSSGFVVTGNTRQNYKDALKDYNEISKGFKKIHGSKQGASC